MTEYIQSFQPDTDPDLLTRFDSGDEVNLHAAQETLDTYQVGHERAVAAQYAEVTRTSLERPLAQHEEIARVSLWLTHFRLWEIELEESSNHGAQLDLDSYELTDRQS